MLFVPHSLFFFILQSVGKDMEQRRPYLNKQITASENLKNKTSNPQMRATITDQSKHHFHLVLLLCLISLLKNFYLS